MVKLLKQLNRSGITEILGIKEVFVIGASEGGFIGSNYALYSPQRVKKLVLLGPMGYGGTTESLLRIIFIQFFPLKSVQNSAIPWAFGDNPKVLEAVNEWFRLMMTGTFSQKARPVAFTAEQRQRLKVPILMVLGKNDNLVGDPENTKMLVRDIPDIHINHHGNQATTKNEKWTQLRRHSSESWNPSAFR